MGHFGEKFLHNLETHILLVPQSYSVRVAQSPQMPCGITGLFNLADLVKATKIMEEKS